MSFLRCFSCKVEPDDSHDGSGSSLQRSLEEANKTISQLQAELQQAKDRLVHHKDIKEKLPSISSPTLRVSDHEEETQAPASSWRLPDEIRSTLQELFHISHDPQRSKLLHNDLLVSLGVDVSALIQHASPGKLSYEDYEVRVAREWELARKASSLADMDMLRVMAECIPGGSVESPLAGLQGMTASALSALWQTAIAGKLKEALGRPGEARGREAGVCSTLHNSKYSLNEAEATDSEETREAVYGKIEEYYRGLIDRIGLPQTGLMKAMEEEHCRGEDAEEGFTTSNYGIRTTAKEEWLNVTDPERRQRLSEGKRIIRGIEELREHAMTIKADLREEELIALQLYTGPLYYKYNSILRAPDQVANKYTTTLHCMVSGLVKLARHTPLTEDRRVWRGLKGLKLPKSFLEEDKLGVSGGVEYGLLSTTTDVGTAIQYAEEGAEPIVLEISCGAIDRGASLAFLSQYPGEEEILYPPLSYLEVLKKPRQEVMEGKRVKVLQLRINANVMSSTIEDMLGKRKQLYAGLMENIAREVERDLREWEPEIQERLKSAVADRCNRRDRVLLESIKEECRTLVEASRRREAEWYNEDSRYKEAIELSNSMKDMAINKLRHWIEDTQGDWKCPALTGDSMKSVYWKTMAGLMFKIASLTPADSGRQELCKRLCGMYGLSIASEEEQAEPPTVTAVVRGQGELIPLLKAAGCDMDGRIEDGRTGLHVAAMLGRAGSVRELIEAGAEVGARDGEGRTCIHWAGKYGHVEVLKRLREMCGVEKLRDYVREKTNDGWTCTHLASVGGQVETLRYLAETCGKVLLSEKTNDGCTYDGWTCAHLACQRGQVEVLRYLAETCGKELLREKTNDGRTCAHVASLGGQVEVLRYLAETCGEELLREKDNFGKTCADEASEHEPVVEYLQGMGIE